MWGALPASTYVHTTLGWNFQLDAIRIWLWKSPLWYPALHFRQNKNNIQAAHVTLLYFALFVANRQPLRYPIYLPQKLEIPYSDRDSLLLIFNPTQVGYPRDWKRVNTFGKRLYIECTIHITPLVMSCLLWLCRSIAPTSNIYIFESR